ncbi:hypothetical protein CIB84_012772 [Bambusicola thoracicus]|uniref:Uncharacterized protein n=1 Tax=Bambusicola thoracicus TaxID=9083 RepID=A0A2P4SH89_BAMTH|nr:hypothetical protein CIB84_012772 [Bambusicola thoracicus]
MQIISSPHMQMLSGGAQ